MAEHKHGSMNIESQQAAFSGFLRMSRWVIYLSIGVLIFMALVNS